MKTSSILQIKTPQEFLSAALSIFQKQAKENAIYRQFLSYLNISPSEVKNLEEIPFMPISFFKDFEVKTGLFTPEKTFSSSGTTGKTTSHHLVKNIADYHLQLDHSFKLFFGEFKDFHILPLLPAYAERSGSSLIDMVNYWMYKTQQKDTSYFLYNHEELYQTLQKMDSGNKKVILIGVSFALLDFAEKYSLNLQQTTIIETGGMKGRKKEITRTELHHMLKNSFGVPQIQSEYGMTELLSQAYAQEGEKFTTPPWMHVMLRDPEDPLSYVPVGKSGGINIIDLMNLNSCSFIATDDLGRKHPDGSFEVLGRFDNSDVRGCNLMLIN